jgi:hypothetical protein
MDEWFVDGSLYLDKCIITLLGSLVVLCGPRDWESMILLHFGVPHLWGALRMCIVEFSTMDYNFIIMF